MSHKDRNRNPVGVCSQKPIALRLMPDERADADRISTEHNISRGNLARQAYLAGLPIVVEQLEKA